MRTEHPDEPKGEQMAADTSTNLRSLIIYSVFVRNHTPEGTFRSVIPDLPRIKELGADAVWLMPIHPIGEVHRKGTLGSPYANKDYRSVNPEYGTMDDFIALVDAIHDNGMKCLIDVVYNHTSPDSVLYHEHPEFFYHKPNGKPGNHVGDWSDVIDLDYDVPALWDYQNQSLCKWAHYVDGFRCDVASFVPVEFWERARKEVAKVRTNCIWLAETVHRSFGERCRAAGMKCARDIDAYRAFDIEYSYDVQESFDRYLDGKEPLSSWLDLLDFQETVYPQNYDKLRYLENHDLPRIASKVTNPSDLRNFTAMLYFLKGTTLLYAGQEASVSHKPTLFDRDTISWKGLQNAESNLSPLMAKLSTIKKTNLDPNDSIFYDSNGEKNIAVITRASETGTKVGVFSLKSSAATVKAPLEDGMYENLLTGKELQVKNGMLQTQGSPIIITTNEKFRVEV